MRTMAATAGLCVLAGLLAEPARADELVRLAGRVALAGGESAAGARVSLFVDLNHDGKAAGLEVVSATVQSGGRYQLVLELDAGKVDFDDIDYVTDLLRDYAKGGFEGLLGDGPLPVFLTVEREGYSTVVRKLMATRAGLNLDATLVPLSRLDCTAEACLASDGTVEVRGLSDGQGVARAYAQGFDPKRDRARFPGVFADDERSLLISSAFAEISLVREDGSEIHELDEPVQVRMAVDPGSFATLVDLAPDSDQVELPMYSFDQERGQWLREDDGLLVNGDNEAVSEAQFAALRKDPEAGYFISFATRHFSYFNCDEPVESRACVEGRLTDDAGKPLAGVSVDVQGASYVGSAGAVVTDAQGYFAADAMKSEDRGEDVDGNGKTGETFTARVTASGAGVFMGSTFETPRVTASVFVGRDAGCIGRACSCVELGDIEAKFELPRACRVRVRAKFSGRHRWGSGGPLAAGDAVAKASVSGTMQGLDLPVDPALCADDACDGGADDGGVASFVVPVVGNGPVLDLHAQAVYEGEDGERHYYDGSATLNGCKGDTEELTGTVELELDHAPLEDIAGFFGTLVSDPAVSCSCALWASARREIPRLVWLPTLALPAALVARRRRRRAVD